MRRSLVLLCVVLLACFGVRAGAGKGPDAESLLAASGKAMAAAKSYESTWLITTSMGSMGSMKMKMEMKALPQKRKVLVRTMPAEGGSGMMAMGAAMGQSTVVMNGNTMYMYMPMLGGYYKQQLPPDAMKSAMEPIRLPKGKGVVMRYLGVRKLNGKVYDAVATTFAQTPQSKQVSMTMDMVLYLDRATHRMRAMKQVITLKNGPAPPGAPASAGKHAPMVITTVMQLMSEKFNAPIPENIFNFTPPPGAKELPMPGAPGGSAVPGFGVPGMGPGGAAPH